MVPVGEWATLDLEVILGSWHPVRLNTTVPEPENAMTNEVEEELKQGDAGTWTAGWNEYELTADKR